LSQGSRESFRELAKLVESGKRSAEIYFGAVCASPLTSINFIEGKTAVSRGVPDEMSADYKRKCYNGDINDKISSVPCRPMSDFLKNFTAINFLSLDIEGSELTALQTTDFRKVHIDIVMIDLDDTDPKKNYKIRQYMFNLGFVECLGAVPRSALFLNMNPSVPSWKCPFGVSTKPSHFAASAETGPNAYISNLSYADKHPVVDTYTAQLPGQQLGRLKDRSRRFINSVPKKHTRSHSKRM
jgi:hypothetical protein